MKKIKKIKKIKKPQISIGTKLIGIISLLIIVSLTTMIALASMYFKDDSELRIIENNHIMSSVIALKVKTDFASIMRMANLLSKTITDTGIGDQGKKDALSEKIFANDEDLIYICIGEKKGENLVFSNAIANKKYFNNYSVTQSAIEKALEAEKSNFINSFNLVQIISNISPTLGQPVIAISVPLMKKDSVVCDTIVIVCVNVNSFIEAVKSSGIIKNTIVNSNGDIIAHQDIDLVIAKVNISNLPIFKMMKKSPIDNGQTRYADEHGVEYLGSFNKIGFASVGIISAVEEDKAFAAVYQILKRNALILIIVLNVSIIIGFFFSKTITNPIFRLARIMKKVEEDGRFDYQITDIPNDELGLLMKTFNQMNKGLSEKEKIKTAFGKFVNKEIAEKILNEEINLGGERKEVVVFFSDIRSFTEISEKMQPEEVVAFLNEYMSLMVNCVNETFGIVDKFIGDAIMAVWGMPMSRGNDTENAINCALKMREVLIEFNKARGSAKKPLIKIGCGINTGPVLAGQIGSQDRMEYTVIGDTVNLASRIESLNKPFATDILLSHDSYLLVKDLFVCEKMRPILVKGKEKPQQIWAVIGRKNDPSCPSSIDDLRKTLAIDTSHMLSRTEKITDEKKYSLVDKTKPVKK